MKKIIILFLAFFAMNIAQASAETLSDDRGCREGFVWDVGLRTCTNPLVRRTEIWKILDARAECPREVEATNCLLVEFPGNSIGTVYAPIRGFSGSADMQYLLRVDIWRSSVPYRLFRILRETPAE